MHPKQMSCADGQIRYIGLASGADKRLGKFEISNLGRGEIRIPLSDLEEEIDSRNATTESRRIGASGWVAFNPILEEVPASQRNILIGSGDKFAVKFDANGLFIAGQADPSREYSVVFRGTDGCEFRSDPFSP
jgi:hypothetical protein